MIGCIICCPPIDACTPTPAMFRPVFNADDIGALIRANLACARSTKASIR